MDRQKSWTAGLAAMLLWGGSALAQPTAGDWEITLGGNGGADTEFNGGGFSLAGSVGYFYTDNWEVALRQAFGYTDFGRSSWAGTTRVAADYHFNLGAVQPFIGANIGYVYGRGLDETFAAAPEAGVKWYVKEKTFVFGMVEYQFFFDSSNEVDDRFDDGQWTFSVGVGFNL